MSNIAQHVNEIPLGDGIFMREFFLGQGDTAAVPVERGDVPQKTSEMDRLVRLYHAEDFMVVGGKTIPAIHDGTYRLDDFHMDILEGSFEPGSRFRKVMDVRRGKALEKLVTSGGHDGKNVSVRDWHISPEGVRLVGQPMYYTQFKSTDAVQDQPLKPDDESFPEGATLRDYALVNGRESRKGTDILSNLLGAAFIVQAKGQDGQDYFVLGRRQRGRTSEGGELGVIGGTPMWEAEYFGQGKTADFARYMKHLGQEEHHEELLLQPDEIEIGNSVYLVRTLVRVFDPFYTVDVDPAVTVEDIAARCYGNAEALKEHDRLYAVPRTEAALHGLLNNRIGYSVGQGTLAGIHLALQAKK